MIVILPNNHTDSVAALIFLSAGTALLYEERGDPETTTVSPDATHS